MAVSPTTTSAPLVSITKIIDDIGVHQGNLFDVVVGPEYPRYTDDRHPTLAGTTTAGRALAIFDNGIRIGTTVADAQGQWQWTTTLPLLDGDHGFQTWLLTADGAYDRTSLSAQSSVESITVHSALPVNGDHLIDQTAPTDLTPPMFTGITDDIGPNQGLVSALDTATLQRLDDTHPTLRGLATPGTSVMISIDPSIRVQYHAGLSVRSTVHDKTYTTVADAEGHWSVEIAKPLANGTHSAEIVLGGVYSNNPKLQFQTDVGSMLPPIITDVLDHTQQSVRHGQATTDHRPTLTGTAQPGSQVDVYDNGVKLGQTTAGADWIWHFIPDADLSDVIKHEFQVVSVKQGSSTPAPYGYTVMLGGQDLPPSPPVITSIQDDTGPNQGQITQGQGVTDDTHPTLHGTSEPGTRVEVFDNGSKIGETVTGDDWQWQYTPEQALPNGLHAFSVTAWATGRQSSASSPYVWECQVGTDTLPMTAPVITDLLFNTGFQLDQLSSGGSIHDPMPVLRGTGTPGTRVEILDNGNRLGETLVDEQGHWHFKPDAALPNGTHQFTAQAFWLLDGTTATASNTPFVCAISTTARTAAMLTPIITGLIDDIGSQQGVIPSIGNGQRTDDPRPTITGTAEPGSRVALFDQGIHIGDAVTDATWHWAVTPTQMGPGQTHTLTAQAAAPDGPDSASTAASVSYQTVAPALTLGAIIDDVGNEQGIPPVYEIGSRTSDLTHVTDDRQPTFTGDYLPYATISVSLDTTTAQQLVGTTTVDGDGHWRITPATPLDISRTATIKLAALPANTTSAPEELLNAGKLTITDDATHAAHPTITGIVDDVGPVQGPLALHGASTDDTQPTFTGTSTPDATVSMMAYARSGVLIEYMGSTTADSSGHWTLTSNIPLQPDHNTVFEVFTGSPSGYFPQAVNLLQAATLDILLDNAGLPNTPTATATASTTSPAAPVAQAAVIDLSVHHDLAY